MTKTGMLSSGVLCTVLLSALAPRSDAQVPAFSIPSIVGLGGGAATAGYTFSVGVSPLTLTDLGIWDEGQNGLVESHKVTLWTSAGVVVGSAIVPSGTAAPLTGAYRYVSLGASPLTLAANTTYTIGALYSGNRGADIFPNNINPASITTASGLTLGAARAAIGDTFPTTDAGVGGHYMAPNFKFTLGSSSAAPEPGTLAFLALGVSLVLVNRRRAK